MAWFRAAALGVAVASTLGCGFDLCGNHELARFPSPDGRRELLVFERDCGATTDFVTHLSLVEPGDALDDRDGGNVYIEEDGPRSVEVRWDGPRSLVIRAFGERFRAETELDGLAIRYE